MCTQQLVSGDRGLEAVAMSGRECAVQISPVGNHPRFIERRPDLHAAVQFAEHDRRVVGEPARAVGVEPAAQIVERGGKIPVKQRERGLDAVREQRIDQPVVEIETRRIDRAAAARQDATPRRAEAIRLQSELAHQSDIVGVAPVMVAGDVAGLAVADEARRVREALPDARSRAVGQRRALDLICRGRSAPEELGGKFDR